MIGKPNQPVESNKITKYARGLIHEQRIITRMKQRGFYVKYRTEDVKRYGKTYIKLEFIKPIEEAKQ